MARARRRKEGTHALDEATINALEKTLRLEPGPGNTRNGEGDFLRLRDGRWMLVYSRFRGGSGADHHRAELAARDQLQEVPWSRSL